MTKHKPLLQIPGYDPYRDAAGFHYDEAAGQHAIDFCERFLVHVKGPIADTPFILEPWEKAIIANMFGWKKTDDGTRRYKEVFVFVPRKNGKTFLASAIALYALFCDGEPGAEIYCAAAERDQAGLLFGVAQQMVLRNPHLSKRASVFRNSIALKGDNSFFKAISADASTKHGYNPHCGIIDELHAQPNRELVDVLATGMLARKQPLLVYITTSDYDRPDSICNEKYDYACRVRDGNGVLDPRFLPVIYEATKDDDWNKEETWYKANPNLGKSISLEAFRREYEKAKAMPSFENTFKRLHLNLRTEQDVRWIPMDKWDECPSVIDMDALRGKPCWCGIDLASTMDITAFALVFRSADGMYTVVPHFWIPRDTMQVREAKDRIPYSVWVKQGLIHVTEGNVTDYEAVRRTVNELAKVYQIKEIAIDRWNATQIATDLGKDGFEMVAFGQGFASMSAPSKEFEKLVVSGKLNHGGNPVLRWMASNVVVRGDEAGNIKPTKKIDKGKIDGIVATIMALGRIAVYLEDEPSPYKSRGFLSI